MHRFLVSCAVVMAAAVTLPSTALAWAPASAASVHPGVQTFTEGGQCTANFVYSDGTDTFTVPSGTWFTTLASRKMMMLVTMSM